MDAARTGAGTVGDGLDGPHAAVSGVIGGDGATEAVLRQVRAEAQEAERARLAREIHDGPAQTLSNAIFHVGLVERLLGDDPDAAARELRRLRDLLRQELDDVRGFISQLRPSVLDELGLNGALHDAAATWRTLTGSNVTAALAGPPERLNAVQQTVVLRVAQEALQNIRKHAAASNVVVATGVEAGDWFLEVRDDGQGFDVGVVAARRKRNFGMQFMRERAALIGARLDVRSHPDGGTIVRLAIPMGAEESR